MATEAPKRKKNASRKNKKSWRKNVDIEDVEEFLEEERLEERLGGKFADRKDEQLFVVDASNAEGSAADAAASGRIERRKARAARPLKCFQNLEVTAGAADPIKKRNRVRTRDERRNPTVVRKEEERKRKGVKKAKDVKAEKDRRATAAAKAATALDRATRRRTNFEFDLWDAEGKVTDTARTKIGSAIASDDWIEGNMRLHNLKSTRSLVRKLPDDYGRELSRLNKVEVPHPGASYNPSYSDHQDLLWKSALTEVNKEKAAQRIEYHTTKMFPDKRDAPTQETYIKEMSEGIKELGGAVDDDSEGDDDHNEEEQEEDEDTVAAENKPKTRKQRRKEKEAKANVAARGRAEAVKKKNQDLFRMKSLKKSIAKQEALTAQRVQKRKEAKEAKKFAPAKLSKHKYEEPEAELKLSDELSGNLRSMKPEGNLLADRFKSLQKRNVIETRVKAKIVKNPKKRKRLEKRNYKMPWEKPRPLKA